MSSNLMQAGGATVYGNRFLIDINSRNYEELIQEIFSEAIKNNLAIEINYTYSTAIDINITSLTIKGSYNGRKSFFLKIEKAHKINTKRDLLK